MASASPALIVSNPRALSGFTSSSSVSSMPFTIGNLSQTVVLSRNFHGLRRRMRSEPFYASPSIWASRVPRRSFIANAISEGIALRGLFIIDKEAVIQHSTISHWSQC